MDYILPLIKQYHYSPGTWLQGFTIFLFPVARAILPLLFQASAVYEVRPD